ncbi:uronyl 2-sulfotransferase-like [Branchiostoma floridae x Branchiostoma belcheri]
MATFQVARPLLSFVALSTVIALWTIPYLHFNFKIGYAHKERLTPIQPRAEYVQEKTTSSLCPCVNHSYSTATKVFYNRMPKSGSNTVKILIRKLKDRNGYGFFEDPTYLGQSVLYGRNLSNFAKMIHKLPTPSIYEHHTFYIDFQQLGLQQPAYINLVRDPIEQRISGYYYMRFGRDGQNLTAEHMQRRTDEEKSQTFDDCVFNNLWECNDKSIRSFLLTRFFCGHDAICLKPSQLAVEKAKENIRRHYAVVGVLEEFSSFLKVLEGVMPQFFRGAYEMWREIESTEKIEGLKTANKRPVSEKARGIMRERLKLDYQVYDFIKERFHMQKTQLGIKD